MGKAKKTIVFCCLFYCFAVFPAAAQESGEGASPGFSGSPANRSSMWTRHPSKERRQNWHWKRQSASDAATFATPTNTSINPVSGDGSASTSNLNMESVIIPKPTPEPVIENEEQPPQESLQQSIERQTKNVAEKVNNARESVDKSTQEPGYYDKFIKTLKETVDKNPADPQKKTKDESFRF